MAPRAQEIDPSTPMFLNEYNTIEYSGDKKADPLSYKRKLEAILSFQQRSQGTRLLAGIGLQGHFTADRVNIAYMRSALDILATAKVPIWLTEVSVTNGPNQVITIKQV